MDRSTALVVAFVKGKLAPSIRTLSVEEYRRAVESLGSQVITLTASDFAEVLRRYLEGAVSKNDFCDWIQVLSWGVHPQLVKRSIRPQSGGGELVHKMVRNDKGIKKINIEFEAPDHDMLVETVQAIEDDCETETGLDEKVILRYVRALSRRE
jgi:hypothetical protein